MGIEKEKLKQVEDKLGVYLFKDKKGKVIYIGKANSLDKRILQHFQSKTPKTKALISKIEDFDYILVDSPQEALILENNLIKFYKPKYNIRLKDDKAYPYIKITQGEEFGRLLIERHPTDQDSLYYGPYADVKSVRKTLRIIKEIFPIRTCNKKLPTSRLQRPCLNFYIKRCLAPCQGTINKEDYNKLIMQICQFLEGNYQEVIDDLKERMRESAACLDFEKAAIFRDRIQAIERIMQSQRIMLNMPWNVDIINFAQETTIVIFLVLQVRRGRLINKHEFYLNKNKNIDYDENSLLSSFVKQFYMRNYSSLPQKIILPFEIEDKDVLERYLREKKRDDIVIITPHNIEKDEIKVNKEEIMNLIFFAKQKAQNLVVCKTSEDRSVVLSSLKEKLKLDRLPRLIEGYDISCLSGDLAVGACVVFEDGKPNKQKYRRYKIKFTTKKTDIYFLEEVLTRRFQRLVREKERLPDLVLVDGGMLQLNKAQEVLFTLGLDKIPIIALAKEKDGDLIYKSGDEIPIVLSPTSSELLLLCEIRDEAHRFCHKYHLTLRSKTLIK